MKNSHNLLRWFGNSKVVDKSGNPLVMYHGTDAKFNEFMHDKVGSNYGLDKVGFFFTSDKDSANRSRKSYPNKSKFSFTDEDKAAASGGYVMPVYLKVERPLYAKDIPDFYSTGGELSSTNLYDSNRDKVAEALSSGKYDGFLLKAEGSLLAIVLDPSQVKSVDSAEFSDSRNIYESEFKQFVAKFHDRDSVLVEAVLSGYSLLFENAEPIIAYHGTNDRFDSFDPSKTADSVFWFSTDKDYILRGDSGAAGTKYVMKCLLNLHNTAGWDEFERLSIDQLIAEGYDSVKLDDDYIVFEPSDIKVLSRICTFARC